MSSHYLSLTQVKISGGTLVTEEEVESEDILVALDPYVAVVNVTGGRAGGKICPHTIGKMFNPAPCKFGSEALFGDLKARDEAAAGYHRFEWSILANLDRDKVLEAGRLALRMITKVEPDQVTSLSTFIGKSSEAAPEAIREAVKTFNMDISAAKEEDKLVAALMGMYLTRNLVSSGYVRYTCKPQSATFSPVCFPGFPPRTPPRSARTSWRCSVWPRGRCWWPSPTPGPSS